MYELIEDTIGFYSLTAIIGLLFSLVVLFLLGKRRGAAKTQLFYLFVVACVGVFLGGHLLFFLVGLPGWIEQYSGQIHSVMDFLTAFGYGASGLVFYGGMLCALLCITVFCRVNRLPLRPELNNCVVVFPLFHFFGRIGCTLTGCCYGVEYHGPLAIRYTEAQIVPGVSDHLADFTRFPIQPLEAVLELALFFILLSLYIKTGDRYPLTCIYLLCYSVIRFLDEFLRGDMNRGIWGPFSTSQWISLAVFVSVIVWLLIRRSRRQMQQSPQV